VIRRKNEAIAKNSIAPCSFMGVCLNSAERSIGFLGEALSPSKFNSLMYSKSSEILLQLLSIRNLGFINDFPGHFAFFKDVESVGQAVYHGEVLLDDHSRNPVL